MAKKEMPSFAFWKNLGKWEKRIDLPPRVTMDMLMNFYQMCITPAQLPILQGLSEGLTRKQLEEKRVLSGATVKHHVSNMVQRAEERGVVCKPQQEEKNIYVLITLCIHSGLLDTKMHTAVPEYFFTNREWQIVRRMCVGLNEEQIAHELKISEYTVKNHKRHIYEKMSDVNGDGAIKNKGCYLVACAAKTYKERGTLPEIVDEIFERAAKHKVQ